MAGQVTVQGAARLRATMRAAGRDLAELKAANQAVSDYVAGLAESRAPRRTGTLAGTLRGTKAAGRARVLAGRASVPYAGPIHWGWEARNIEPNPWIQETAQDSQTVWLGMYLDETNRIINSIEGARR